MFLYDLSKLLSFDAPLLIVSNSGTNLPRFKFKTFPSVSHVGCMGNPTIFERDVQWRSFSPKLPNVNISGILSLNDSTDVRTCVRLTSESGTSTTRATKHNRIRRRIENENGLRTASTNVRDENDSTIETVLLYVEKISNPSGGFSFFFFTYFAPPARFPVYNAATIRACNTFTRQQNQPFSQ